MIGDFVHGITKQKTDCNLCDLAYTMGFKKKSWRAFLKTLPIKSTFYLKDRFVKKIPDAHPTDGFPALFLKSSNHELLELVNGKQFNSVNNLNSSYYVP